MIFILWKMLYYFAKMTRMRYRYFATFCAIRLPTGTAGAMRSVLNRSRNL